MKDGESWRRYYRSTGDRPPRRTLCFALDAFEAESREPGLAVDLGCGNGRDTVEMLRRGWRVLAIDAQASAIEELLAREDLPGRERLETRVARFERADLPRADLVSSSFALPLCEPPDFDALWGRIAAALGPGGRFAAQLYGDRDAWVGDPGITFHTRADLDRRLEGFEVELLEEEESDGPITKGRTKHWHLFHVVARKAP